MNDSSFVVSERSGADSGRRGLRLHAPSCARGHGPEANGARSGCDAAHRTNAVELSLQGVPEITHLRRLRVGVGVPRAQCGELRFDGRQLRSQLAFDRGDAIESVANPDLVLQVFELYFDPGDFDAQSVLKVFDLQLFKAVNANLIDHLAHLLALLLPILLPFLLPLLPLLRVELERLAVESEDETPGRRRRDGHGSEELSVHPANARPILVNKFEIALVVHIVKVADGELTHGRVGIVLGDLDQFIDGFAAPVLGQRADDVLLHFLILQSVINLDQGVRPFVAFDIAEIRNRLVAQFLVLLRFGDSGQLGDGLAVVHFVGAAFAAQQVTDYFAFDLYVADSVVKLDQRV